MTKTKQAQNAWEYIDWLHLSGRLTTEEYNTLKMHVLDLTVVLINEGC